ncbi:MAG: Fpg/Nei family DNA glycosylase [Candidatus Dormibacteraeota bacterium]|uniref:Endonuclease VIII n=1 Tax=Candidatus Aeolococcus gillhamiae TaxID=3127015 RepID=A0A2W5ZI50_9BACT|nr:Fpg/Nei family DNA glycosylase [Candidatus Dormibacteraeota bacterium]PZR82506.1 MAG: endonuclease VIII [Candidatus Dormibacter sp. RRmetagenome_bin12]
MPELPEVTALSAGLTERMRGQTIIAVRLRSIGALKTYDPRLQALVGHTVDGWDRHGKFLDMTAGELHLVVHLARAGWIRWRDRLNEAKSTLRGPLALQLELAGGCGIDITEQGTEHRLAVYVVRAAADVPGIARLGVDVLDDALSAARLGELLQQRRGQLKTVLADQSLIAGVGNAYSDEILHAARLSPFRQASALSEEETMRLHAALRSVMSGAVERARGVEIADLKPDKKQHLAVHGRTGDPCPVCGDTIREVSLSTRSFQYCPTCQTGGRVLADRRLSRLLR